MTPAHYCILTVRPLLATKVEGSQGYGSCTGYLPGIKGQGLEDKCMERNYNKIQVFYKMYEFKKRIACSQTGYTQD